MKKQGRFFQLTAIALVAFLTTACAPQGSPIVGEMSSKALDNLGCESLQSSTFDELYKIAEFEQEWPSSEMLKAQLKERWKKDPRINKISKAQMDSFIKEYAAVLDSIKNKMPKNWESLSREDRLGFIAALEMEDETTQEKQQRHLNFQGAWKKVESTQLSMKSMCSTPKRIGEFRDIDFPEIYGSRKVFATAYQGCSSLDLPVMDDQTPALQGVSVVGSHPMGGNKREITNLTKAYQTHYYIFNQQPDSRCQDLSRTPLIYDFGGKPFASSTDQAKLNFFINSGSGSKELGVDCGGYVFSAMMAAGLRLQANKQLKAAQIYNISASAHPVNNKYTCLDFVPGNSEIEPGDIASTSGHIIMVDAVGSDPFGIKAIKRVEDCRDGVINSNNFNFVISQSSPSKGAIGINRIEAATYTKEASSYRAGFMSHAIAVCKSRFGVSAAPNRAAFWLIRHKKTPECRQPEIKLEKEECISRCI